LVLKCYNSTFWISCSKVGTIPYLASSKHNVFSLLRPHKPFRTRMPNLLTCAECKYIPDKRNLHVRVLSRFVTTRFYDLPASNSETSIIISSYSNFKEISQIFHSTSNLCFTYLTQRLLSSISLLSLFPIFDILLYVFPDHLFNSHQQN
jgi:hypothetical protein